MYVLLVITEFWFYVFLFVNVLIVNVVVLCLNVESCFYCVMCWCWTYNFELRCLTVDLWVDMFECWISNYDVNSYELWSLNVALWIVTCWFDCWMLSVGLLLLDVDCFLLDFELWMLNVYVAVLYVEYLIAKF